MTHGVRRPIAVHDDSDGLELAGHVFSLLDAGLAPADGYGWAATLGGDARDFIHCRGSKPVNKSTEELAAEILIAAVTAHAIRPSNTRQEENAKVIGEAYKLILERVNQGAASPTPRK